MLSRALACLCLLVGTRRRPLVLMSPRGRHQKKHKSGGKKRQSQQRPRKNTNKDRRSASAPAHSKKKRGQTFLPMPFCGINLWPVLWRRCTSPARGRRTSVVARSPTQSRARPLSSQKENARKFYAPLPQVFLLPSRLLCDQRARFSVGVAPGSKKTATQKERLGGPQRRRRKERAIPKKKDGIHEAPC